MGEYIVDDRGQHELWKILPRELYSDEVKTGEKFETL